MIESSAGQAFLVIPELAWVADDAVLSEAQHRQLLRIGQCWVVADEHDRPCAFIAVRPGEDGLHIEELAVHADRQRQGLGRALMQHVIEVARQQGVVELTLTTFRDIAWNAPFYARLGFRILEDHELSAVLRNTLDTEVAHGFRRDSRCAMALPL
ncbi:hypothetical protein AR456_17720 [Halomonas huangheensis]|nr:hypothetical protein AR456_17720 [Halomonas huangheensis]